MEDSKSVMAKCWVLTAFCLSFGGLIGGVWILVKEVSDFRTRVPSLPLTPCLSRWADGTVADGVRPPRAQVTHPEWEEGSVSVAVRALLQNLFIFASSIIFRAARIKADA